MKSTAFSEQSDWRMGPLINRKGKFCIQIKGTNITGHKINNSIYSTSGIFFIYQMYLKNQLKEKNLLSINKQELHLLSKPCLSFGWTELQFSSHCTNTGGAREWHEPHLVTPCPELVSDRYQFKPPESRCDAGCQWQQSSKWQLRISKAGGRRVCGLSACLTMRAVDKEGEVSSTPRQGWFHPHLVVTVPLRISLMPNCVPAMLPFLWSVLLGVLGAVRWGCNRNALTGRLPPEMGMTSISNKIGAAELRQPTLHDAVGNAMPQWPTHGYPGAVRVIPKLIRP